MISYKTATVAWLGFLISAVITPPSGIADEFRVLAWNVESNRPGQQPVSDSTVIGNELMEMLEANATRSQLIALSAVEPRAVLGFAAAVKRGLSSEVDFVTSASGGFAHADTLMLIADRSRFSILDAYEIHRHAGFVGNFVVDNPEYQNVGTIRARSPLAVRLKDNTTRSTFWIIVNHLARGEADLRTEQAKMLRAWPADQTEPVIAAGDFNFDFDFATQQGNDGFKAMLEGDVWQWLKPNPLIDTNWSDDRSVKDRRVDRYPDSMLDFIFVANQAKKWRGECKVVVRPGDFPDSDRTSDHRPIVAKLHPAW